MIRFKPILLSIVLASGSAVICGTIATASDTQLAEWVIYRNLDAGIEISHPRGWEVIVAEERLPSDTAWRPLILGEGELFKVSFRESGATPWPGQYEIRVLSNPDILGLEAYWANFDLSDLWDQSAADSTLAGRPSKTWVRWRYDSLAREHLLMITQGAVHVLYDEHNSNDPAFSDHQKIYRQMSSTFMIPSPEEAAGDSTEVPPR